ncbi:MULTISPECIES: peptide chain release factor N(5)-glutamine methyltransferase [Mycobacteriaceae]|uniref:Release factor glutamine methyltransferase n=1 Tax=Mycolicibacterium neoaurum VKM Ac-1815D TaxID=700508 RepID=V5XE71_MYCNE|nr:MULTISPECIES: peptide chain release factor N(5)-glutamine methyltransferase [Mycobacteriaceae]AHC26735.1 SAM-dependent methyltransferase [Mycolicibacterium neoaurum VKM Ac-1815D]AMO07046.1 SAM-dependent methyltransferase [Mycolicibacterium neoaurum]AXK74579.1 peptide chain release factor N(5)-glutamine methyltransferase [Mycolicibacterium neoaurum]KJQ50234.1 SAM-dependent methyltransferase [Mycolicibacterium neoaurum]KUM06843.1 protein-(glutamine-N5) methyltransferase, release factor-specif
MSGLRREISDGAAILAAAGIDSARADAEQLAAHIAGVDRGLLAFVEPEPDFGQRYRALVDQRARRVPLQHLIGTAAFGPVTLTVGPGVFIPRPETEALLEWAHTVPVSAGGVIVDLCTGSAALALALAAHRPDARVIAVERSAEALRYARMNTEGSGVELVHADVRQPGLLAELDGTVELIVANPPYIPDGAVLEPEVAEHDPHQALFGGPDGMDVIVPIVGLAARLLRPGGRVGVEHDDTTSAATADVFAGHGAFDGIAARRDLTGRPRFVTAVRS